MKNIARLRDFIQSFTRLIEQAGNDEERIFADGKKLLSELVDHDDWLPDGFAQSSPERYQPVSYTHLTLPTNREV